MGWLVEASSWLYVVFGCVVGLELCDAYCCGVFTDWLMTVVVACLRIVCVLVCACGLWTLVCDVLVPTGAVLFTIDVSASVELCSSGLVGSLILDSDCAPVCSTGFGADVVDSHP